MSFTPGRLDSAWSTADVLKFDLESSFIRLIAPTYIVARRDVTVVDRQAHTRIVPADLTTVIAERVTADRVTTAEIAATQTGAADVAGKEAMSSGRTIEIIVTNDYLVHLEAVAQRVKTREHGAPVVPLSAEFAAAPAGTLGRADIGIPFKAARSGTGTILVGLAEKRIRIGRADRHAVVVGEVQTIVIRLTAGVRATGRVEHVLFAG